MNLFMNYLKNGLKNLKRNKMNYELIEKLRNGEIMAINNGSLEDLHDVLNCASHEDVLIRGHSKYYGFEEGVWYGDNSTDLPTVNISSFFLPTPKMIPVEELELLISQEKYTDGLDEVVFVADLQTIINKYK